MKQTSLLPFQDELLRDWDSYCEGTMPVRKAAHFRERMEHAGLIVTLPEAEPARLSADGVAIFIDRARRKAHG